MGDDKSFLREALELARANIDNGGRPFGAVVVRGGEIVGRGVNEIVATRDPTAHAELLAIRDASRRLGTANLEGCAVYASGHPCPMCLAAMRLAGVREVTYAYTNEDGAPFGLSTADVYADLAKPFSEQSMKIRHVPIRKQAELYSDWKRRQSSGN